MWRNWARVFSNWRRVDDECEGDRSVFGTMADGSRGHAPAAYFGTDTPGAGTTARHLAAGPRMDRFGYGAGPGTGSAHYRTMVRRLWRGRACRLDVRAVQCPPPPRPMRDAAGGVEVGGAEAACHSWHRTGQLDPSTGSGGRWSISLSRSDSASA